MVLWQWCLLALGIVWALQTVGVWLQVRHYATVMGGLRRQFSDGYAGTGYVRGRIRKGTIALLVVSPDLAVRRLLVMSGRSVFTAFKPLHQYEGMTLDSLRETLSVPGKPESPLKKAVDIAIAQIERTRAETVTAESEGPKSEERAALGGPTLANA